jgi:hypothetical protein
MPIEIGPGIVIGSGVTISSVVAGPGPDLGTTVPWTSGTYFNSWTSQSGVTTSDIASYNTNNLVWQLLYAWQAITIPVLNPAWGIATTANGSNTSNLRYSLSSVDDTVGSFEADAQIGTNIVGSYTAGGFFVGQTTASRSIPANRYFLLGITGGPFYRSFRTLAANRTATISGNPVFTVINRFWWPGWPTGPTTGVPTQLGGSTSGYTERSGFMPVTSFIFTV